MRIDKFLKVSRLIKRREIAKRLCDDGDIFLNGKVAKPSAEVISGDELELRLGKRKIIAKILDVRPYANKSTADTMYEIVTDTIEGSND